MNSYLLDNNAKSPAFTLCITYACGVSCKAVLQVYLHEAYTTDHSVSVMFNESVKQQEMLVGILLNQLHNR